MSREIRLAHGLIVTCLLALILLLTLWIVWLSPPANSGYVVPLLLLLVLPLLLPLRGLLHGRRYTAAWTSLLAVFYFAHGVAAAWNEGLLRWLGGLEIALSLGLFTGCLLYIQLHKRSANP
ncbi:MAG: DUF2069 domain-containing protein [Ectothiorhodospiraceae bacterium]|nr:DUF2069 domain-containing protein [Ectothiorhodospiraceae bacterium]MCH8505658.1 DUF2069 domain-containing protein [Ectothiorhodospiraceae bacterium]